MGFTNSPLATVKLLSPNKTPNRKHVIDTITIHCFVGQVTAKRGCEIFQSSRAFIKPGVYTIVSEANGPGAKKWGKLKSGAVGFLWIIVNCYKL